MVRFTELSAARRGALQKLKKAPQSGGQILARFHGLVAGDDSLGIVSVDGGPELRLPLSPGKYVPGSLVSVLVDAAGKPVRVLAPRTDRPEGADDTAVFTPVTAHQALAPAEFSPEDQAKLDTAVADLDVAQTNLDSARTLLEALGTASSDDEIEAALAAYMDVDPSEVSFNAAIYDAVLTKLLVATEIVTDTMLATGAVTAPKLNVVYSDPVSGFGFSLQPEGLTILDRDGNPAIVLRADMTNYFSVVKDGVAQASISPDGEIVGQSVAANQSLTYRGIELEDRLDAIPLGIVSKIAGINQNLPVQTSMRGVMTVNFTNRASRSRVVQVTARLRVRNLSDHLKVAFYGEASTTSEDVRATLGSVVRSEDNYATFSAGYSTIEHTQFFLNAPGQTWSVLVGVKSDNTSTSQIVYNTSQTRMWARDEGLWPFADGSQFDLQTPDLRGAPGDGTVSKKDYSVPFNSNGFRTFPNSGTRHVRANDSVVQGWIAGVHSTGHWYFPSVTSTLNGATDMSGTLTIVNQYTGSSAGMTIGLRAHNYASNPGSFGDTTWIADIHVGRGQTKTITLPPWVLNGLKAGTIKGFGLSHLTNTSINWYGYFSQTATLRLNYTK